jgi:hypothetical protein
MSVATALICARLGRRRFHVLDGHVRGEIQGVTLEGVGVAFLRVGERHGDLTSHAASLALHARDLEQYARALRADGHTAEQARHLAVGDDLPGTTERALQGLPSLLDGEHDFSLEEVGAGVAVAPDAEGVVE